jgi:uncharacterized protein
VGWRRTEQVRVDLHEHLEAKGVQWIPSPVTQIDAPGNALTLQSGQQMRYDYLVIATGPRLGLQLVDDVEDIGRQPLDAAKLRFWVDHWGDHGDLAGGSGQKGKRVYRRGGKIQVGGHRAPPLSLPGPSGKVPRMKFSEDAGRGSYLVDAYDAAGIVVAGRRYARGLGLSPQGLIEGWGPAEPAGFTATHLAALLDLDSQVILIGTGPRQVFLHPALFATAYARGVGVEVMDTGAASGRLAIIALLSARLAQRTSDADAVRHHALHLSRACRGPGPRRHRRRTARSPAGQEPARQKRSRRNGCDRHSARLSESAHSGLYVSSTIGAINGECAVAARMSSAAQAPSSLLKNASARRGFSLLAASRASLGRDFAAFRGAK